MLKKIVMAVFIVLAALGMFLFYSFSPTPNMMRNQSVDGVTLKVDIIGDDRRPIIRSFREKDYKGLSEEEMAKVKDTVDGKIEGDIPSVDLLTDNKLYFRFEKEGKVVAPEQAKIRIFAHASHWDDPQPVRIIEGDLMPFKDNVYYYPLKRYSVQFEEYFMEYLRVEVHYTIDGENFVSTFGVFQNNAEDGTDFFKNEELTTPIEPE